MHGDANFYELLHNEVRLVPRLAWTLPFRSPVSGYPAGRPRRSVQVISSKPAPSRP